MRPQPRLWGIPQTEAQTFSPVWARVEAGIPRQNGRCSHSAAVLAFEKFVCTNLFGLVKLRLQLTPHACLSEKHIGISSTSPGDKQSMVGVQGECAAILAEDGKNLHPLPAIGCRVQRPLV